MPFYIIKKVGGDVTVLKVKGTKNDIIFNIVYSTSAKTEINPKKQVLQIEKGKHCLSSLLFSGLENLGGHILLSARPSTSLIRHQGLRSRKVWSWFFYFILFKIFNLHSFYFIVWKFPLAFTEWNIALKTNSFQKIKNFIIGVSLMEVYLFYCSILIRLVITGSSKGVSFMITWCLSKNKKREKREKKKELKFLWRKIHYLKTIFSNGLSLNWHLV